MIRPTTITNEQISGALHETADLLQVQGANEARVGAYRIAAETVRQLNEPASEILDHEGTAGLMKQEGIGRGLANHIKQLIETGHLPLLDRLRGEYRAECSSDRLQRPNSTADIETRPAVDDVPISEILDVDREYRRLSAAGKLPRIAPVPFNPAATAWLPVLHTQRSGHRYTALYCNTARAQQTGKAYDWVVIYRNDALDHDRWTAITSGNPDLCGKRIILGRESECAQHYSDSNSNQQEQRWSDTS